MDMEQTTTHANLLVQIFAKAPVLGKVKTRLAKDIGQTKALALYTILLEDVLQSIVKYRLKYPGSQVEMWVTPPADHPLFQALSERYQINAYQQIDAQLGDKMIYAIKKGLERSDYVVVVGSDCVTVDQSYLAEAEQAMRSGRQLILGPAQDGGFVLMAVNGTQFSKLGLERVMAKLFHAVEWGGPKVLLQILLNARRLKLKTYLLDTRRDVDYVADLAYLPTRILEQWEPDQV